MTHTAQELKELAKRAIDESKYEAARFLIESLSEPLAIPSSYESAMVAHATAKVEMAASHPPLPFVHLPPTFTQQEMSAAVLKYAQQRDDRPFRFEDVARYIARQHTARLDFSTGNPGDRRPRWRRQVSKALGDFVEKSWLARGEKNTHYVITAALRECR